MDERTKVDFLFFLQVTLDCREGHQNDPEQAPKLVKRVQLIHNCSCSSCEKQFKQHGHGNDDDLSLIDSDMPDIFNSIHSMNTSGTTHEQEQPDVRVETKHRENLRSVLNNTLMTLLKNIQESNSSKDKAQLKDLLKMMRDQYPDENYSDESIAEIVESFNSDTISLDIPKLKEILFKFELYKDSHKQIKENSVDTNEVHFKAHDGQHHVHKSHHHGAQTKLDMNPGDFKPNHAGTMLSYNSHHPGSVDTTSDEADE